MANISDPKGSASLSFRSPESFVIKRIFPIRNIVDTYSDRGGEQTSAQIEDSGFAPIKSLDPAFDPPPFPELPLKDELRGHPTNLYVHSDSSSQSDGEGGRRKVRKVTKAAQYVPEKRGATPGATLTEAGKTTFHRCEDEPIHIPGAIQSYGALVALKYGDEGKILVRIASENTKHIIGYSPEQLFQLHSFYDLFDDHQRRDFVLRFDHILKAGHAPSSEANPDLDVFSLTVLTTTKQYWCRLHLSAGSEEILICEMEAQDDTFFSATPGAHTFPRFPVRTVEDASEEEERLKSITSMSQPIHALSLTRSQNTKLGYKELFSSMSQVQVQLAASRTLQHALDVTVGIVQDVSRFHRVMVYRFDQQHNGAVVAELVDPRASEDFFRGLHFPASDIPKQARDLYRINKIRILYDRDSETARLVCRDGSDFARPLDLTHSYLRAMSPVHLKYLANMGVRSSMSISLMVDNDLWGLVACHSYGEQGVQVPLLIRELCRNIGECASMNIERLITSERLSARKPLAYALPHQNPSGFIAASSVDLLKMFGADFGMLSIRDEARTIGKPTPYREALALLAFLQKRQINKIVATRNINVDFPAINYEPGLHSIAGMLVIPLSMLGKDFIVFFRLCHLVEVKWAGNPYQKTIREGTQEYLEPRASFQRWSEKVEGTSKDWTDEQLETASILGLLYGRFIEVWRQKELAVQRSRMTKLLLRNSSHEVRTPLNAIINYLEIALENGLDGNVRETIEKAHKASRSLVYVIDDLLSLTKVEHGRIFSPSETFDLWSTVSEVVSTFKKESMRRGLGLVLFINPGLPTMVKGDPTRLRQILSNVISNAFQNSVTGGVKVDVSPVIVRGPQPVISITVQDLGVGMSEKQLDELFQDFEQIVDEDDPEFIISNTNTPHEKKSLGIGLAVVARYVRNMNGQIIVGSEIGKGTMFTIEVPLDHISGTPLTEYTLPTRSSVTTSHGDFTPGSLNFERITQSSSATDASPSTSPGGSTRREDSPDTVLPSWALVLERSAFTSYPPQQTQSLAMTIQQKRAASQGSGYPGQSTYPFPVMAMHALEEPNRKLKILVAEDNPINARMLSKRLERSGHEVVVVSDGRSCFDVYEGPSLHPDAILMDLQMPLIDGHASTRMIRQMEREHESKQLDSRTVRRKRVPIFAVSASLTESQRFEYIQDGFDGWVPKPIDYNRLEVLMQGVYLSTTRRQSVYTPGKWEDGGWFLS